MVVFKATETGFDIESENPNAQALEQSPGQLGDDDQETVGSIDLEQKEAEDKTEQESVDLQVEEGEDHQETSNVEVPDDSMLSKMLTPEIEKSSEGKPEHSILEASSKGHKLKQEIDQMVSILETGDDEAIKRQFEKTNLQWARVAISKAEKSITAIRGELKEKENELGTLKTRLDEYTQVGSADHYAKIIAGVNDIAQNPQAFKEGLMQVNPVAYNALFGANVAPVATTVVDGSRMKEIAFRRVKDKLEVFKELNILQDENDETGQQFIETLAGMSEDIAKEISSNTIQPLLQEVAALRAQLGERIATENKVVTPEPLKAPQVVEPIPAKAENPKDSLEYQAWSTNMLASMQGALRAKLGKDPSKIAVISNEVARSMILDPDYKLAEDSMDTNLMEEIFYKYLDRSIKPKKAPVGTSVPKTPAAVSSKPEVIDSSEVQDEYLQIIQRSSQKEKQTINY